MFYKFMLFCAKILTCCSAVSQNSCHCCLLQGIAESRL